MNFFDLVNISEKYMKVINPSSPEKILKVGEIVKVDQSSRVLDVGAGFGETLALWGKHFQISGIGVDIRPYARERAEARFKELNLEDRLEFVCMDGKQFKTDEKFDVVACLGATFIYGDFKGTLESLGAMMKDDGRAVIGERYLSRNDAPESLQKEAQTEYELLTDIRKSGFELEYIIRSSQDEWDRYICDNWYGLIKWLEQHPDHPEKQEVLDFLHEHQADYLQFEREFTGWAIYIMRKSLC